MLLSTAKSIPVGAGNATGWESPIVRLSPFWVFSALYPTPWISRLLRYPLETPSILFPTSVWERPCRALWWASSPGRLTVTCFPSNSTLSSGWSVRESSPLGPLMRMVLPDSWTLTSGGTGTGFLPIRDMGSLLPDQGEELAAEIRGPGVAIAHQALGGGDDRDAEAVPDSGKLAALDVPAES